METIINYFNARLGEPTNPSLLLLYVTFCLESVSADAYEYAENHHILPRSIFPEFILDSRYIVRLKYEDHVSAHFMLFSAYPTKKFQNPLNFMASSLEEKKAARETKSLANSIWWSNFRKTPTEYDEYCKKRSDWMLLHGSKGSEFHRKVCEGVARFYSDNPQRRDEISKEQKEIWNSLTNDEREARLRGFVEWHGVDNAKNRSDVLRVRYSNHEFKKAFDIKMQEVNKRPDKRAAASVTIKENWLNDEDFKEKMKARKPRGSDGSKMKEKWNDPEYKQKQREIRIQNGQIKPLLYDGVVYYGWAELKERTGMTEHYYNKWKKENETN